MLSGPGALSGLNDLMELIILVCEGDFDKKKTPSEVLRHRWWIWRVSVREDEEEELTKMLEKWSRMCSSGISPLIQFSDCLLSERI